MAVPSLARWGRSSAGRGRVMVVVCGIGPSQRELLASGTAAAPAGG
jgi:hypothetical protein